ncbi:UPF0158 family protein [Mesonia sp.]|uniref:UPF0158 family protein n=1 Tax=Mesonia sp. TaxID=1960830 RepID=UPI003F965ED6
MAKMNSKIIKEIAGSLDCGEDCYLNRKTGELICIPNFSNFGYDEYFEAVFEDDTRKVAQHPKDFIKFEVLESFESFKIMESFVESITENQFRLDLERILQRKKPFQNFKHAVESSKHRQVWFDFKRKELEKIVGDQFEREFLKDS